jgi:hypothetical protein
VTTDSHRSDQANVAMTERKISIVVVALIRDDARTDTDLQRAIFFSIAIAQRLQKTIATSNRVKAEHGRRFRST